MSDLREILSNKILLLLGIRIIFSDRRVLMLERLHLNKFVPKQTVCAKSKSVMLNRVQHLRIYSKFALLDSETSSE